MSSVPAQLPKAGESEPKLRHEFVGMMFAVAIGEVGIKAAALVHAHHWLHYLPAWSHLILATTVIAASWVGWTLSPSPGARRDVQRVFQWEFLVLLFDVILVVVYFILVSLVDFTGEAGKDFHLTASAAPEALWIFVIFALYLGWDILTKIPLYFKLHSGDPWIRRYGVRMVPTLLCLVLAWIIKRQVGDADPPHVVTADIALLGLVLLFRALKDLASVFFQTEWVESNSLRSPRVKALLWTALCCLVLALGLVWTKLWPVPRYFADPILSVAVEEKIHSGVHLEAPEHRLTSARQQQGSNKHEDGRYNHRHAVSSQHQ